MSYQIFRKTSLPGFAGLEPNSFYIVSPVGGSQASLYYVDANKNVRAFLNEARVQEMLNNLPQSTGVHVVGTSVELNGLPRTSSYLAVVVGTHTPPRPELYVYLQSLDFHFLLSDTHQHSNLPVLEEFSVAQDGTLLYRGNPVASVVFTDSEW